MTKKYETIKGLQYWKERPQLEASQLETIMKKCDDVELSKSPITSSTFDALACSLDDCKKYDVLTPFMLFWLIMSCFLLALNNILHVLGLDPVK